jgi:hypothetical protein
MFPDCKIGVITPINSPLGRGEIVFKKIVVLMGVLALLFGLTACGQGILVPGSSTSTASAAASQPPAPTFTAEQELATKACLTEEERKALKPEGDKTSTDLLAKCREVGKKVFDGLNQANKANKVTAGYAEELATTDSLQKATFAVTYLKGIKDVEANGVAASDTQQLAAQIKAMLPNADQDDVLVGSAAIDLKKHTIEKGGDVFYSGADRYLKSQADIAAFLNDTNDPAAVAARDHVVKAVVDAGGEKERTRALTGAGYIPIQMEKASQILGTSYFQDGKVKILGQWRQSLPGDLYWLYVTTDMKLVPEATLRADCGNMEAKVIRIIKPGVPPAPPVSQPPGQEQCPPGTVLQPNGECHIPPTVTQVCPPEMPHGTWPVCKDGVENAPQNQGNLPQQQMPNVLPAEPQYAQPEEPANPGPVYTAPAQPAPQPAPVTQPAADGSTVVVPAPSPNPEGPRPTAPPETGAPAPSEATNTCIPAPGKTTC